MVSHVTLFNFRKFLDLEKLQPNGSNYITWYTNLTSLLNTLSSMYVIKVPLGEAPALTASQDEINVYQTRRAIYNSIKYGILLSLEPQLQILFERQEAIEMIKELKNMFAAHAQMIEIFKASQELARLNVGANRHNCSGLTIKKTTRFKAKRNSAKRGPKPNTKCFYCEDFGHWKWNCPNYLEDKRKGNIKRGISSDIHVIDVYLTSARSSSWVLDTGSVANICNLKQDLRNIRRLQKDEVTMRMGNGCKVDVVAVRTYPLDLPSGLVLNLSNCYLVPALSMNNYLRISFTPR